jgi:hypothetical protein
MCLFWADYHYGATVMKAWRRFSNLGTLAAFGLASSVFTSSAMGGDLVLIHSSFSVQVVAVDEGIDQIALNDFYEISYTINQSVTDQNSSIGAGTFPGLATAFSLAARPLNALPWHPMGTFDVAGSNYVTNAFGDNFTFQVKGSGFPNGGPGLSFFDLRMNWSWPDDLIDSGLGDQFGVQLGSGTGIFDPARAIMRPSFIRFLSESGDFVTATILPETPTLAGDYNANGVVDAADYTVWRNSGIGPGLLANDATPGTVSAEDYDVWKAHFSQTAGSGSLAGYATPEPAGVVMLLLGVLVLQTRQYATMS